MHPAFARGMPLAKLLILCAIVWSIVSAPCCAAPEIPFEFRAGMIWVKVNLEGRSTRLNFLLDSGAGKTVMDLGSAQRLKLNLGARETVQGVDGRCAAHRVEGFAATVGPAIVPSEILALDLRAVSVACGARIDGLLGADFFRDRVLQIDFAAQKIRLLSRDEFRASAGQLFPLVRRNDALCVRVGVDGNVPQWMRLDTGCSSALEWVTPGARASRAAGTSIAAKPASRGHVETEVLLGSERISRVKTGIHSQPIFAGEDGLIGNGLLSKFQVTVDASSSRLLLQRVVR